jgi:hypothetical protein
MGHHAPLAKSSLSTRTAERLANLIAVFCVLSWRIFVSATRTPSCKDSRRNAMLRHDQALKEGLDEVANAGFRAVT